VLTPADIAKLAAAVAATILVTLLWVHCSAQRRVDRSALHSVKVALRLLAIHAAAIYVLCVVGEMPANVYLVMTAVLYAISSAPALIGGGSNVVEFAFVMAIFLPAYLLRQFVLGFPDAEEVILKPPKFKKSNDPPPRKSDTGTVVATLRPMGKVELAGEQFDAVSAYGHMIDVGTPIRVTGHRGGVFLVTAQNIDTSETHAHGTSA